MQLARRRALGIVVAAAIAASGGYASAQLGGGGAVKPDQFKTDPEGFTRARFPPTEWPDRDFTICRVQYNSVRSERDGSGWKTDYPYSEINLLIRLEEMTPTAVSYDAEQKRPNTWVIKLTDTRLYDRPFLIASDVATLALKDEEIAMIRENLLNG